MITHERKISSILMPAQTATTKQPQPLILVIQDKTGTQKKKETECHKLCLHLPLKSILKHVLSLFVYNCILITKCLTPLIKDRIYLTDGFILIQLIRQRHMPAISIYIISHHIL